MANVDVDWAGAADAQEKVFFSIQSLGKVENLSLEIRIDHGPCFFTRKAHFAFCLEDANDCDVDVNVTWLMILLTWMFE